MLSLWNEFASGAVLGLSAGLSPGPLLSLVITEAVASGPGAGVRVALSPLVTDVPIIVLCTFLLAQASGLPRVLGGVSLAGGCFILLMALDAWKARIPASGEDEARRSLLRGVLANILSPHPYLFWITVGSPLLMAGWRQEGAAGPGLFLAGFYGCLVGSKIVVAVAAGRSRGLLAGRGYRLVLRVMAAVLGVFALLFFWEGLRLLATGKV
ncbi:LysE family translocator [Desulfocurvus sp. DL9XJH121]